MPLPDKVAIATVGAIAFSRLKRADRALIEWASIPHVVTTFLDKKGRVEDTGVRICNTLKERGIAAKSREVYAAWARLLRKVEAIGIPAAEGLFDVIPDGEMAAAIAHVKKDERYAAIFAPKRPGDVIALLALLLFRAMAIEVQRRRTAHMKLMFLCGTVVREFAPDTDRPRRLIGQACKSAFSHVYRGRKKPRRKEAATPQTEHPVAPDPQYRLI